MRTTLISLACTVLAFAARPANSGAQHPPRDGSDELGTLWNWAAPGAIDGERVATGGPRVSGSDCNGNGIPDDVDIAGGTSADCNSNAIPDECELPDGDCNNNGQLDDCEFCPPINTVDITFILDTSGSMYDELITLCAVMDDVVSELEQTLTVHPEILWIAGSSARGATGMAEERESLGAVEIRENCWVDSVANRYGSTMPGLPEVLGACEGLNHGEGYHEDWGPATAIVAESRAWTPRAVRVIVPLSDEGPRCGTPVDDPGPDRAAIDHAIPFVNANNVVVSPIIGTPHTNSVITMANALAAAGTSGSQVFRSDAQPEGLAAVILQLVTTACDGAADCNTNGVPDECDIAGGTNVDCQFDGIPDVCQIDCNGNSVADECDILAATSPDCDGNAIPDECDLAGGAASDCNQNAVLDVCDIYMGTSADCQMDGRPDDCDPDCNVNGVADDCDITAGTSADCDCDRMPDECAPDANSNGTADACELFVYTQCAVETSPYVFHGWDEVSMFGGEQLVADDWSVADNRPITEVLWWGSYRYQWLEITPPLHAPTGFHIGIWSDDSADAWGHPGTLLADWFVDSNAIEERYVGVDTHATHGSESCFIYRVAFPPEECFQPTADVVYWLSIAALYPPPQLCACDADLNHDGRISVLDLAIITHPAVWGCAVGSGNPTCDAADVNCDGVVEQLDVDVTACQLNMNVPGNPACCGIGAHPWGWKTRSPSQGDPAVLIGAPTSPIVGSEYSSGEQLVDSSDEYWDMAFQLRTNVLVFTEACCDSVGTCVDVPAVECAPIHGGWPQGPDTRCASVSCQPWSDCNSNGVPDNVEIACGTSSDCNTNGVLDECDLAAGTSPDCNGTQLPDECELSANDCDGDGVPDDCQMTNHDCNTNAVLDQCEIAAGTAADCNTNAVPDQCDLTSGTSLDANGNAIPDECEPCSRPPGTGDTDSNAFVDLNDYATFCGCLAGPGEIVGDPCAPCDLDGDCDVDLRDFAKFQCALGHSIYPETLYPTDDTQVDHLQPNSNFGGFTELRVRNAVGGNPFFNNEIDTLVRFDLSAIPPEAPILSATLNLYYFAWYDNNPAGRELQCRALLGEWYEYTVTWNNLPAWASTVTDEATVPSSTGHWMTWDASTDVRAFIAGTATNFGWIIRDEVPWGAYTIPYTRFRSKEHGATIPFLAITYAPPTRGACCLDDGSCIDVLDQDECGIADGAYQGALTECASTTCPQPEACCLPDGSCAERLIELCIASNGTPQGPGSSCATTECPQACCFADGTCDDLGSNACLVQYGLPQGAGTMCTLAECPQPQACCSPDGACDDLAPPHCIASNGVPLGAGTTCATDECPQACCLSDGQCDDLAPSACIALSGVPQGAGTDCTSVSCPQPEACCHTNGFCVDEPPAVCVNHGGFPQGESTDCILAACDVPEACCYPDGLCLDELPAGCASQGGTPQGVGTDCLTAPPCPVEVLITQVRSLADHHVGTFGFVITPDSEIESRSTGIHHLEVTFNLPMDELSCEDPANLLITDGQNVAASSIELSLDSNGTELTIRLDPPPDPLICWYFDLTGMLSAGLVPLTDPAFAMVGLPGDVLRDGAVGPEDLAEYAQHEYEPVDENNYYIDVAPSGHIGLDDFSIIATYFNQSASCP